VITPNDRLSHYCALAFPEVPRAIVSALLIFVTYFTSGSGASLAAEQHQKKGEQPYALIFGTVWGPDDRPLHGVKVSIQRTDQKKGRWELYSDHNGEFAQRVPAGRADYLVTADVKDYKFSSTRKLQPGTKVRVHVENDERTDIGLHLKYQEL
jgi:hypothetical protein